MTHEAKTIPNTGTAKKAAGEICPETEPARRKIIMGKGKAMSNATLDINTPKGRQSYADQLKAVQIVYRHAPDTMSFVHTAGDDAAPIDGFLIKNGTVSGVAEIKSRNMTREQLFGRFQGEWLLTFQKLKDMGNMCSILRVNGYGLLYLIPSRIVLAVQLCSFTGGIVCQHRIDRTETRATINGGIANRVNAYIQMNQAKEYHDPQS